MEISPENKNRKRLLEGLDKIYGEIREMRLRHEKEFSDLNNEIISIFKRISQTLPESRLKSPDEMLEDELYHEAYKLVVRAGMASTAYLQRMLGIGYTRSVRLMEMLEQNGVISAAVEGKPREVLLSRQAQQILKNIEAQLSKKRKKSDGTNRK